MASVNRAFDRGNRLGLRHLAEIGEELRERRLSLGLSQEIVAAAARMSRSRSSRVENAKASTLSVLEVDRLASVLGLDLAIRLFPGGTPTRDRAHASKLSEVPAWVNPPLRYRIEVPLPAADGRWEQRAWDAMITGSGARTAIELEMRLRDVQAAARRINLKRRDDPTDRFLLVIADTRTNRMVLRSLGELFADLPRLRRLAVRSALHSGLHPPSGILVI